MLSAGYNRQIAQPGSSKGFTLLFFFIFLLSDVAAIITNEPWLVLVSFVVLLGQSVFNYIVIHTEQFFWLLFITLPLSTEFNITPSLGIDLPDEFLLMLLTGIAFVKLVHQPRFFPRSLATDPLFAVLIIYLLWLLITCMYSTEPLLSVKYILAKSWYIIPFVILPQALLNSKTRLQKMALCLLVPMLLVVIQVIIRHSFYGFSFESIGKTMNPFFRNHVNYSSMLVCLLPVAWCVWKLTPQEKTTRKWLLYGIITGMAGLLFAYSRGAWIALLVGIFITRIIRKRMLGKAILLMITVIMISTAWLVTDKHFMRFIPDHDRTIFHTDFKEHMFATVALKDVSNAERFYRWVAGARMLADKPVTGFGPNAFYLHYHPYTVSRFQTWVSNNPEHSTVHNYFILVALEQGVPGVVLFCVLYFGMLLATQKLYHALQSNFYKTIALTTGSILAMIGVINCTSDMIETDKIGSLFWLCLGIIVLLNRELAEEKHNLA